MLLLFLNRANEAKGDIPFGGCLDQGVAILLAVAQLLFEFRDPPLEAGENLFCFFGDVGELSIREVGEISNENFAVVSQSQKRWPWALAMTSVLTD